MKATIAYLETQVEEHTFLGQHGQFVTNRDYPKFVIQEMVVNACCHRAYNIKGTEIQIKMLDDRLVFESPGRLPGTVKPSNIRHTHFSRNPKIAQFLKAYDFVKEFGEGVDRVCRELEANGTPHLSFHLDDFILKITVPKVKSVQEKSVKGNEDNVTDNHLKVSEKVTDSQSKVSDRVSDMQTKVTDRRKEIIEKVVEKALENGDKLTSNRITILQLMAENPYITKIELAAAVGISATSIMRNIEYMRNKYLRRIGPDNGGFWEIIE